jgi:hypothetical protein
MQIIPKVNDKKNQINFNLFNISIFCSTRMSSQTIQWENIIGGNDTEWVDFIELSKDENYILGGYSYSNISGDKNENSRGLSDYWFIKIDDTSVIYYGKNYCGNSIDHLTAKKRRMAVTSLAAQVLLEYLAKKLKTQEGNDD